MPETLEDLVMRPPPTADRPLLGAVVLVVEDSRHSCEALRLICQRSGARIRRAESLASAERHLRSYRPHIAVIDLGLPDGSGLDLIGRLSAGEPRTCGLIAISGDETLSGPALSAGADVFLAKPFRSIEVFQRAALSLMPPDERPATWAKPGNDAVEPDVLALCDDLFFVADQLRSMPDAGTLDYLAAFLGGLAKTADDERLAEIGSRLAEVRGQDLSDDRVRDIADEIAASAKAAAAA